MPVNSKQAYNSFVIITLARSGSYLLVEQLDQAPGCSCLGEIFKPQTIELKPALRSAMQAKGWTVPMRDRRPRAYIDTIRQLQPETTSGFKIFLSHSKAALKYVLNDHNCLKIFLVRNPLSRYISQLRAEATGRWIEKRPAVEGSAETQVVFDGDRFEQFFLKDNNDLLQHSKYCGLTQQTIVATYEEVIDLTCFEKVCSCFGSLPPPKHEVQITLKKQIILPYQAIVSNYHNMLGYLKERHPSLLTFV